MFSLSSVGDGGARKRDAKTHRMEENLEIIPGDLGFSQCPIQGPDQVPLVSGKVTEARGS